MSLCGKIVVIEKKTKKSNRKRKLPDNDHSEDENNYESDDGSTPPLSYTYTNCDSSEILREMEHHQQQQQQYQQSLVLHHSSSTLQFDDDDDSTLGTQQQRPPIFRWLTWRMDPIKSFSDWSIDVIVHVPTAGRSTTGGGGSSSSIRSGSYSIVDHLEVEVTQQKQRYRVHKNILVVESQLFQTLFHPPHKQQQLCRHSTASIVSGAVTTTEITLPNAHDAAVFPTFLDYMYSPGSVWITPQNVNTMYALAKYFGMKRLQWLAKQFLKLDESIRQQYQINNHNNNNNNMNNTMPAADLTSFKQRMNNLSRFVDGESANDIDILLPKSSTIVAATAPILLIDTPPLLQFDSPPLFPHSQQHCRDDSQKLHCAVTTTTGTNTTGSNNHNHISTNSSTTTVTNGLFYSTKLDDGRVMGTTVHSNAVVPVVAVHAKQQQQSSFDPPLPPE